MAITAQDINKLRTMTGAGMMDCKKALTEANGDFEAAIDLLRKRGEKMLGKRMEREAKEGAIFAALSPNADAGVLLELNCETDFVARNDDFQALGQRLADAALAANVADVDTLKTLTVDGKTVDQHLAENVAKIGEKLEVSKVERLEGERLVLYIHPGSRIGVLVAFANVGSVDLDTVGKDVAMQVAAMSPVALSRDEVDPSLVEREMEIGREQARQEGKPDNIVDKIAQGKLQKFYKETVLLEQEFVKNPDQDVKTYLKQASPELQATAFKRLHLG